MDPTEKIKVSPEEMGNLISLAFQKFTVKEIFKECLEAKDKNEKSWRFKTINNSSDEKELYRMAMEWFFLEAILLGQAILDYFRKNKKQRQRIYEGFIETCGKELFKAEFFDSLEKYYKQINKALDDYKYILAPDPRKVNASYKVLDRITGGRGKWSMDYYLFILQYYNDRYLSYYKLIGKTTETYLLIEYY
jgi:hypothetical protein